MVEEGGKRGGTRRVVRSVTLDGRKEFWGGGQRRRRRSDHQGRNRQLRMSGTQWDA